MKLYDNSQGLSLRFLPMGNATIQLGVSVNAKSGKPLGYSEWVVSLRVDDDKVISKQEQAYGTKLTKFTKVGELPNSGLQRKEALGAAAAAMDEVKKQIDVDPEMQGLGVRVNQFGVRPNEVVGKILQEKYGYKNIEGKISLPESGNNPLDVFLRS